MVIVAFLFSLFVQTVLPEKSLDITLFPHHYDISIDIFDLQTPPSRFRGHVCIKFKRTNKEGIKHVNLQGKKKYGLEFEDTDIKMKAIHAWKKSKHLKIQAQIYDYENDILSIFFEEPLQPKHIHELCITYSGEIEEEYGYVVWQNENQYIISTNSERQPAFPCLDQPDLRATFSIKIYIASRATSFSNVPREKWRLVDIGVKKDMFEEPSNFHMKEKLSPSQISFVVTNTLLHSAHHRLGRWPIIFSGPYSKWDDEDLVKKIDRTEMTLEVKDIGGVDFPPVQFMIIPSDEEFESFKWGIVNISESELLEPSNNKRMYNIIVRYTGIIFGGLIAPASWDSSWLFHALAEYLAHILVKGDQLVKEFPKFMWTRPSEDLDMNMERGLDEYQKVAIGTNKGVFLLRMVHCHEGDIQFRETIMRFIDRFSYNSARPDQLWELFTKRSKKFILNNFPRGFDSWTNIIESWTQLPSYPLLRVSYTGSKEFKVKQELFVGSYQDRIDQKFQPVSPERGWIIPIYFSKVSLETGTVADKVQWLDSNSELTLAPSEQDAPIFMHSNCIGIYRVKYDSTLWSKIVDFLRADSNWKLLMPTTRACLVHDALSLAWVEYQDYEEVFSLLALLENKDEDIVWEAFFNGAADLSEILLLSGETYEAFQAFVNRILSKTFNNKYNITCFDVVDKSADMSVTDVDVLFYTWACNIAENEHCVKQAVDKFGTWVSSGDMELIFRGNIELRKKMFSIILCTVLREQQDQGDKNVEFIETLYKDRVFAEINIYSAYRKEFFTVSHCAKNEDIIKSLLDWATSSKSGTSNREEKQNSFLSLAQGKDSYLITLEYFYNNVVDKIIPFHKDDEFIAETVSVLTSRMDMDRINEMGKFIEKTPSLKKEVIENAFKEGKTAAIRRTTWLGRNLLHITSLLNSKFCYKNCKTK